MNITNGEGKSWGMHKLLSGKVKWMDKDSWSKKGILGCHQEIGWVCPYKQWKQGIVQEGTVEDGNQIMYKTSRNGV